MLLERIKSDERLKELELELKRIKERNERVEADKAWEVSTFRIGAICIMTYIIAALVMYLIGIERYWLNAFIPTLGFYLSTRSLRFVKKWWIATRYHIKNQ